MQFFAPLARLLGLHPIQEELEELGFKYAEPENYRLVRDRLDELASMQSSALQQAGPSGHRSMFLSGHEISRDEQTYILASV
jgi:(p)ppGpp synthase/HD superfamily hydrolase